jgi:hypothetical protein
MREFPPFLRPCQSKVLEYFRLKGYGIPVSDDLEVTVNFHPDRMTTCGLPVLKAIAQDGVLKSQFETGTSNGGLTAFPGGDRWKWESAAFSGILDDCDPVDRPKYGTLNYRKLKSGGSPRFGSSYFILKAGLIERTTFSYPESYFGPKDYGLGNRVGNLIDLANADAPDLIDHYIEAHIHGRIDIHHDIKVLVLDPYYKGTAVETEARKLPIAVEWHSGFRLEATILEANPEYRGIRIVELGKRIAKDGWITPHIIGEAVNDGAYEAQDLKKVWHYLARFGDMNAR